ncbi:MAG TPA: hypothetical protein PKC65_14015 [Pyrinomonadaceae bacterium]|nr:hypothetical protein [Pyrinomonadaceae bacterium]HMU34896.1 hypothetical protein [Pyrinomonadaceae bacterium]
MNELDSTWQQLLESAIQNAEVSGRTDIVEYLRLKASNDLLRTTAANWLLDSFIEAAFEAARTQPALKIERDEPYEFARGSGRMDGSRLIISFGVRCLEVRAGWPRKPSSGILRGNSLAAADIIHFGLPRQSRSLALVRSETTPHWIDEEKNAVDLAFIARHVAFLVEG